jgi:predicted acetyltransferase
MLADPRRLERRVGDMIWLRLVDVAEALGARTYSAAGRLTIEVRDDFCGWNEGTYLLEAPADGSAACERVRENADLALSVDALGATYLGGVSFATLRQAGRVEELRSGAVSTADGMFRTERAPWCALDF